jgi:hypothetical protein
MSSKRRFGSRPLFVIQRTRAAEARRRAGFGPTFFGPCLCLAPGVEVVDGARIAASAPSGFPGPRRDEIPESLRILARARSTACFSISVRRWSVNSSITPRIVIGDKIHSSSQGRKCLRPPSH